MIYLQWYRDKGKGQEAADIVFADQEYLGKWPVARLYCETLSEAHRMWKGILEEFNINAMTYVSDLQEYATYR